MVKMQGWTTYHQRPLKQTQRPLSPSYTTSSARSGRRKRYKSTIPVVGRTCHQVANKKGDLRECSNYSGITLLSVPGKVLNIVLLEKLKETVNPKL
jgi:hypothetical protein